ncbi:MAG TPA: TetR/AcrR family transcriptional regulator [Polyangiaceae bacterium]|jgi:AcrR family transcriptional regulator|nr:TetR/AcrR family transcriptional regulator [Polyangiaceae bacterium]
MARPQSITDDEVLAAARAIFLDKGITATVEEVAARCGVGEATVFRRFPTKHALFIAAMETESELEWARILEDRLPARGHPTELDIHETLLALAHAIVASGRKIFPLLIMKMSNPAVTERERPPARVVKTLRVLTEFFDTQIKAGRIRPRDPRVAARIWMGTLQNLIMFEALMKSADSLPADELIAGLVELFCGPEILPKKLRKK